MKTRQEYFEEMAKDVKKFGAECFGEHCLSCSIVEKCSPYYFSKTAYHFGYRKASDVIDEFVKRFRDLLIDKIPKDYKENYEHYNYPIDTIEMFILKVTAEMRQEVEK